MEGASRDSAHGVAETSRGARSRSRSSGAALADLRAQADAPIRLPPVDLITERALALRALTESPDVDGARATLRRYLKGSWCSF
jgi:hypothetical protein